MKRIKNYDLIKLVGHGRSAEVYLAKDTHTGQHVAIKLLHDYFTDNSNKQTFLHEAKFMAKLDHPAIIKMIAVDFDGTRPYVVLTYAPNGNLRMQHPHNSILNESTVTNYTHQIALALDYAHQNNVIHGDIKPENILLDKHRRLLLSDFGIAQIAQHTLTQSTKEPIGTPIYAAPEQLRGKAKKASDQYSLAIMVYEWLCGTPPFQGDNFNRLYDAHLHDLVPSIRARNQDITAEIEAVLFKALDKNYEHRFPSTLEFARALEQACLHNNYPDLYELKQSSTLFTILDIGETFAKAMIVEVQGEHATVLGVGHHPQSYAHMSDGIVADIPRVIANCNEALLKAEQAAGGVIAPSAVIGIAGELIKGSSTTVSKQRTQPTKQITEEELEALIMVAQERLLKVAKEWIAAETGYGNIDVRLVHSAVISVRIDGHLVTNPVGFRGRYLVVTLFSMFAPLSQLEAIERVAEDLDLALMKIVAGPYALARCLSSNTSDNSGAIIIDIGSGATDITLVRQGGIEETHVFALGSRVFTRRIAVSKGIPVKEAEQLKISYSNSELQGSSHDEIQAILAPECQTWIDSVELLIRELSKGELLPPTIYIVGGGSPLIDLHQRLEAFPWIERLPFSRQPLIRVIQPEMIDSILDIHEMLAGPQDIMMMSLAYQAIELNNEYSALERTLSHVLDAMDI